MGQGVTTVRPELAHKKREPKLSFRIVRIISRPLEWLWAGGYTCAEKQNPYVEKRCRMNANREYKDSLLNNVSYGTTGKSSKGNIFIGSGQSG